MKMLCAFMYLLTGAFAALSFGGVTVYSALILGALASGFLGDFFLEFRSKKLFPLGAVFFAFGHIVYSYTFLCVDASNIVSDISAVAVITLILSAAVVAFAKTRLVLKGKKNLLLIYAPVLIFAFACALVKSISAITAGKPVFGICLMLGGSLFLASDVMIGLGKGGFERPQFLRNAVSYTYFAAQTLFALSIYFQ
ncbi:MAG: hypothetical protein IIX18_02150 [Clostridia bacterium]|nr:hypothetical protein [Clostridia bacterium]